MANPRKTIRLKVAADLIDEPTVETMANFNRAVEACKHVLMSLGFGHIEANSRVMNVRSREVDLNADAQLERPAEDHPETPASIGDRAMAAAQVKTPTKTAITPTVRRGRPVGSTTKKKFGSGTNNTRR